MINSVKALYSSNQTSLKYLPSCSQTTLSFSLRLCGRGADICHHYCVNSKACTLSSSGYVECVCPARFEGNKCEVDKCLRCHGAPCLINEETGDVVCKWVSAHYSCPSCLLPYCGACMRSTVDSVVSVAVSAGYMLNELIWLNLKKCIGPHALQQFKIAVMSVN